MSPEDLLYSREHEWLRLEADGEATVGITEHAQNELGDIVYVELPEDGASFEAGEAMGSVESVKAVSELFCPAGGEVLARNEELESAPERVNESPYGDGWLVRLRLADPESAAEGLLDAAAYDEFVASEAG